MSKVSGKEVALPNFQDALSRIGDLSFLSNFSESSKIGRVFGLGFDLVCLLGAIIFITP